MNEDRYRYPERSSDSQPTSVRRKKKSPFYAVCPIVLCLLAGAVIFGIWCLISPPGKEKTDVPPTLPVPESQSSPSVQPTVSSQQVESTQTEPVQTESTAPTEVVTDTEAPTAQWGTVSESYFDDALFIGDSRTDGLRLYSPFEGATYYYATSLSIYGVMDSSESCDGCTGIRQLLQNRSYGKIYIMFGINEAYSDKDTFLNSYSKVIDEIRSYQPDALIYIQSIMYVTAAKMAADPGFSNDGLRAKNEGLKAMANGEDVFYLEINDAINDGNGNLPADYTNDGVHMKPQYYPLWSDYLLKNAIILPGAATGGETLPVETKPVAGS